NGSHIASLTSSDSVATGSFVSVKISVSISGRSLSLSVSSSVRSASLSSASPLPQLSGQLIIGGFSGASPPSTGGRSKRSLPVFPASIWAAMPSGKRRNVHFVKGFGNSLPQPDLEGQAVYATADRIQQHQLSDGAQPTDEAGSPYAGVYDTSTDDCTYENLNNNPAKFSSFQCA
uniref:CG32796 n=1 Tax=Macrostomum lignano TaxID=282301 RepID=A0A1I8G0U5_9PLAT